MSAWVENSLVIKHIIFFYKKETTASVISSDLHAKMALPDLQRYPWNLNQIKNVKIPTFFWFDKFLHYFLYFNGTKDVISRCPPVKKKKSGMSESQLYHLILYLKDIVVFIYRILKGVEYCHFIENQQLKKMNFPRKK